MNDAKPVLSLTSITVACPVPRELAQFYARLLSADIRTLDDDYAQIDTGGLHVSFEYEREWTAPTWPSVAGHQTATQHLDIRVEDLAAATIWAIECGATLAEFQPQDDVRVLFDPSGHPFCLFQPGLYQPDQTL
jgi:hypothetical protein